MELDESRPAQGDGDGCLAGMVRLPVKIVAVLLVLPVRVVWDLLVAAARTLGRTVLGPLWQRLLLPALRGLGLVIEILIKAVFYWPWAGLWRFVAVPAARGIARLGRGVYAYALRPVGRGIAWLGRRVYAYALRPVGHGTAWLVRALYAYAIRPVGVALKRAGWALGMTLFVWPWVGLWRFVMVPAGQYVLVPLGRGLAWLVIRLVRYLLVLPVRALYRYGAAPAGRALHAWLLMPLGRLLVGAWQLAGRLSRALGRGLLLLWRGLVARPAAWAYRWIATPVGHAVRAAWASARRAVRTVRRQVIAPVGRAAGEVWRASRLAVREARDDVRRALFGGPSREPGRSQARTLGSNTAAGDTPAPEISLSKQG
ncbi:hypothetical protein ABZY44_19990 [Streptomyces sp. NPDC006544]|uniref:hypothetical protein n=1 Tax=Streptomyces sp. NPDC006544 TaxID=3154583 RepID=UPI0033BD251A